MGLTVGKRKGALADMNVVPLIDILLVLLIIFLVINPSRSRGLDTSVPQPSQAIPIAHPENAVVVQVLSDDSVRINQEPSSWDALEARLTDVFKTRAERVAFIKGDDNVKFEQIARAIDIMHSANIDHVGLMTTKVEAGQ